ncbi:MAG TPA: hypothetical protein VFL57_21615, partial [Bryobacteraceae bacterium]|nr:hypothetical protein [Bryobacteraceae bacterium]
AEWAGFKGKKNSDLLEAAEQVGYEVLLPVDQGIPHQVQHGRHRIAIIVLRAGSSQLEDLRLLADPVLEALNFISPGEVIFVASPR